MEVHHACEAGCVPGALLQGVPRGAVAIQWRFQCGKLLSAQQSDAPRVVLVRADMQPAQRALGGVSVLWRHSARRGGGTMPRCDALHYATKEGSPPPGRYSAGGRFQPENARRRNNVGS